jgi:hypothetical protein
MGFPDECERARPSEPGYQHEGDRLRRSFALPSKPPRTTLPASPTASLGESWLIYPALLPRLTFPLG